ncbi:probable dipeptidylpeptidase III [Ramularia collo-cygni]|uniref:Dipeptidyl peptidase 3 n=1 Tax=Ramularia collo-cygni TaxID=112498 RepID=A0A2D3V3H0_9PEZI|nr:probable dipeptidylpeptidase III [Ramularia collo-cygni]CZT17044.1 probable dipeptidylpeptidase III [Ramularia collo-cygni]
MDQTTALKQYLADDPPTIARLEIKPHFEALSKQEKRYAHSICRAAFAGHRINLRQVSPESEDIYDFILALHEAKTGDWKKLQAEAGVSDEDLLSFLNYSAQFLGNAGNFKSFGDSKFIPRASPESIARLAKASPTAEKLWNKVKDAVFDTSSVAALHLGYPDEGHVSTYYPDSPGITKKEIEIVSDFLKDQSLMPENTRLRKTSSGDFELLIASAVKEPTTRDSKQSEWTLDGELKGKKVKLIFGDHAKEMATISHYIAEAQKNASNKVEEAMHADYYKAFHDGSMASHVDSQRHWIQDKGPMVESNIGFIETYRDPHGQKGEWEGFAAMVNKERTRAFTKLVESAPENIHKLPWGAEFEKDTFLSPDFTSLEVLNFAGSGIPAGINIPNYDVVRQNDGFKNVSLGNVLSAAAPKEPTPFIHADDQQVFDAYKNEAFEVQVGLHELLGHGCGKLLQETEPGVFNFNVKNPPISPIDGKPISSWYKPSETWGTVFGGMGPSYEECRAESVAMSLCPDYKILSIFGFGDGTEDINGVAGDVLYVCYLQMARAGVAALEFWDPNSRRWGQAHMQARFALLQVFLEAGPEFCELKYSKDDLSDIVIKLDRTKIESHGRKAVNVFLQKLQVYKATADLKAGKALYEGITEVNEFYAEKLRPEVLRQKKPRKVFVQANTVLQGDDVVLKEYDASPEGLIQSFVDRDYI